MHLFCKPITTLLLILLPLAGYTQIVGDTRILLRNVTLVDSDGTANKTVNILVKNAKLDIITEDLIPLKDSEETYNAAGGYIFGNLELGKPASFMILDDDPRSNIDVMLDTKSHAIFAMKNGEIVRNRLIMLLEETPEEKERAQKGWLAYAAPPLAVPLDYKDTSRWNRFDTKKWISGIGVAAIVLDRQTWLDQNRDSEFQVGDLELYDGGEIRGLRIGAVGTINFEKPWVWTLFGATHAFDKGFDTTQDDDWTLFDVRLDIPVWDKASFSIGKQKEPISMQRIMSMAHLPQQERTAVADALLPSRNTGVVMAGSLFDDNMTLAGGVFNNWLDKDQPNSFSDNASQFVGRATGVAWASDNESTLLHLGAGYRYSDVKEQAFVSTEPEFNQSPKFVDTGSLDGDRSDLYQLEASLRSGPYWLHGEYIQSELESQEFNDPKFDGYFVTASWVLTGEVRPYNRRVGIFGSVPISRNVDQNGWGAWEVSTRFSNLDANEDMIDGGDMDIWSVGLNWWLTPYFNVNLNYRYITLDKDGLDGNSQGINTRVVLILE